MLSNHEGKKRKPSPELLTSSDTNDTFLVSSSSYESSTAEKEMSVLIDQVAESFHELTLQQKTKFMIEFKNVQCWVENIHQQIQADFSDKEACQILIKTIPMFVDFCRMALAHVSWHHFRIYQQLVTNIKQFVDQLPQHTVGESFQQQIETIKSSIDPLFNELTLFYQSNKSLGEDELSVLIQMQTDELVVLKVGSRFFHTTKKTLLGQRGSSEEETHEEGDEKMQDEVGGVSSKKTQAASLEYVRAESNLFKVMFDSGFGIEREENKSAISFEDRNPEYFEYVLEHLRQGGRVKSLGIEKMNVTELENILEESRFFLTEKLSEYILFLLDKYHKYDSSFTNYDEVGMNMEDDQQDFGVTSSIPVEKVNQYIKETNNTVNQSKTVAETPQELFDNDNKPERDLSVLIDVGGQKFSIPFTALSKYDNFLITKYIWSGHFKLNQNRHIFVDRCPRLFNIIHGYIISGGKFYNFPKYLSNEKIFQLKEEAEFYGMYELIREYLNPLRYPVELLGKDNIKLKEQEDKLRELFVKKRDSPLLDNPYLMLAPLFSKLDEIKSQERYRIDFGMCPKLLDLSDKTKYSRQVSPPFLVNNIQAFKVNWHRFTQGVLEGLDWKGVFAAGGGVLGCLLKEDDSSGQTSESTLFPRSYKKRLAQDTRYVSINDDDDEYETKGFDFWKTKKLSTVQPSDCEEGYPISDFDGFDCVGKNSIFSDRERRSNKQKPVQVKSTVTDKSNARVIPEPNIPTGFKKSDIDLFLYAMTEKEAEEKICHIYNTIKKNMARLLLPDSHAQHYFIQMNEKNSLFENESKKLTNTVIIDDILVVRTKYAVTFYGYRIRPVQVVLRIYKTPAEVLLGFDIDCACVGFDGKTVWSSPRARRALSFNTNLVDVDRQSTTYEYRLYKYAKRGFSVSIPGFDSRKVRNQLLHYPRRFPFTSMEHSMHGLARILALDLACQSTKPKRILGPYDALNSVNAQRKEELKALILAGEFNVKSDYMDLSVIKSDRYPPSYLYDLLSKARNKVAMINMEGKEQRKVTRKEFRETEAIKYDSRIFLLKDAKPPKQESNPDWKPFFIYSLNDIEMILNNDQQESTVSRRIEWITVDPGTQSIGSFHPSFKNFYRDAYTPIPFYRSPILRDIEVVIGWYRATNHVPPPHLIQKHKDEQRIRYESISLQNVDNTRKDIWFEVYPPEISKRIELQFRSYILHGKPIEFWISNSEKIDFDAWCHINDLSHASEPGQSFELYRKTLDRTYNGYTVRTASTFNFPSFY